MTPAPTEGIAEFLAEIIDALPMGLMLIDANDCVIEANMRATELLGMIQRGAPVSKLLGETRIDQREQAINLARAGVARRLVVKEVATQTPFKILCIDDITELTLSDQAQEEQRRLAAVGIMVARVAHQLKTPLAAMLLNTDIAAKYGTTQAGKKPLEKIREQILLLDSRVNTLLQLTRSQIAPTTRENLTATLRYALHAGQTKGHPKVRIKAPEVCWAQISKENLVFALIAAFENAKEADAKQVEISINEQGPWFVITIKDDGTGLSGDAQKQPNELFDPFRTTKPHGNGLGLSLAKRYLEDMGGTIDILPVDSGFCLVMRVRKD